jgi:hypothetical protein
MEANRLNRWLPWVLFALALAVNFCGIGWGLPAGNQTWAADAIKPGAPLSIMHRVLLAEPFNSGWFWFKYPMGHVFILGAAYSLPLALTWLTGGLGTPTADYPWGMQDPEGVMTLLALSGRTVSVLMGAGCSVFVYLSVRRLVDRDSGVAAALLTTLCYPVVFYSHTTNVEIPYVFWLLAALLAAVRLLDEDARPLWWMLLGAATAMSVSTKELGAGFFVGLVPALALLIKLGGRGWSTLLKGAAWAGAAFVATMVVANNVPLNPSGFVNRLRFLTHSLPADMAREYSPYYFPVDFSTDRGMAVELEQAGIAARALLDSLGPLTALLAAAGLLLSVLRRHGALLLLTLLPALGFYLFGLRSMLSLSIRYVLPLSVLACVFAGVALAALASTRRLVLPARALAALLLAAALVYGLDVDHMLVADGRYPAERWLQDNGKPGQHVETWQRATYLPHIPPRLLHHEIEFADRNKPAFGQRLPDFVVVSEASLGGITVQYSSDWQQSGTAKPADSRATDAEQGDTADWLPNQVSVAGNIMNYKRRENVELLTALRDGSLGYSEAARFKARPWIERPLIRSLNPEIVIYQRDGTRAR